MHWVTASADRSVTECICAVLQILIYPFRKKYISKIYSAKDKLLMELETSPTAHRSLCSLGQGKYLVSTGSPLYLWKDGQFTELMRGCYNYRLRKMNHLGKWKKQPANKKSTPRQ